MINAYKISTVATDPASTGGQEAKLILTAAFFHYLFYVPLIFCQHIDWRGFFA